MCILANGELISGHLAIREGKFLEELASLVPIAGVIVEIGSYQGRSTVYLASGCEQNHATVYAVDTWKNEGMRERPRDTFDDFMRNTAPWRDRIKPVRGKSWDVAKQWSAPIDLLFIDGDHSYEAVKRDIQDWLPHVKDGSWVCFHDYHNLSWPGVRRAVTEDFAPRAYDTVSVGSIFAGRKTSSALAALGGSTMFIGGTPFEQTANLVLSQQTAEAVEGETAGIAGFGFPFLPVLTAGSALILGGGTLWHLHERHTEKTEYQDCLEKYTAAPFNMSPQEAALVCQGEVKPKGFQFGLNAPTFVLVAGSVFGLWFMSQLLLQAAKR